MADTGSPIVVPSDMQPYNSYIQDPEWQIRFTIAWTSFLGLFVLFALPRAMGRLRNGTFFTPLTGLKTEQGYERVGETTKHERKNPSRVMNGIDNVFGSLFYWSLPWVELNTGQIFIIAAYLTITLLCITFQAPLTSNPNRAGFLALAQLPPVFLFATKNSILSLILGPGFGYEKLNFIHRWAGRGLVIAGVTHGTYWIRDHLTYNMPILGPQKETSGVACLSLLCVIFLTSLRPVRRWMWDAFWVVHTLAYVAFFVTVCYHTVYARPWVYAPVAFYGLDLLLRMVKMRVQEAVLLPSDKQMTLINVPYPTSGWTAGQHVRLRVFFDGRLFESHPLTIMTAPGLEGCLSRPLATVETEDEKKEDKAEGSDTKCGSAENKPSDGDDIQQVDSESRDDKADAGSSEFGGGILLGARVVGDWTRALNEFAYREGKKMREDEGEEIIPVPVHVMIDGPYGGCSVDLSSYETVLLLSGGSGATFTIGLLDGLVGKYIRYGADQVCTRKIEFVWFIRSYGQINWFANLLRTISLHASSASLDLHITVYVTCLCTLDNLPEIPNCDVLVSQPGVTGVLKRVVEGTEDPAQIAEAGDVVLDDSGSKGGKDKEEDGEGRREGVRAGEGGLVVCASGPERLTREAANGVARLKASRRGRELGRIGLHTEVYAV